MKWNDFTDVAGVSPKYHIICTQADSQAAVIVAEVTAAKAIPVVTVVVVEATVVEVKASAVVEEATAVEVAPAAVEVAPAVVEVAPAAVVVGGVAARR